MEEIEDSLTEVRKPYPEYRSNPSERKIGSSIKFIPELMMKKTEEKVKRGKVERGLMNFRDLLEVKLKISKKEAFEDIKSIKKNQSSAKNHLKRCLSSEGIIKDKNPLMSKVSQLLHQEIKSIMTFG